MNKAKATDIRLVMTILQKRFKLNFNKAMSPLQKKNLAQKLKNHFEDNQLHIEKNDDGKLNFFILSYCAIMPEFNEQFFHVSDIFCIDNKESRRKFYGLLKELAKQVKKERGIRRMIITVSSEDKHSLKYFKKKGKLTYVELNGDVKQSLSLLKKDKTLPEGIIFSTLRKSDVAPLVKLDIESHLKDSSSRMREIFSKPNGKNIMKSFYRNMLKNKTCLVARKGGKPAGSIAWFIDRKNHNGLVASIFVAEKFKGMGISKALYKKMLEEFSKKKLTNYIGSSTTDRVLELAKKLKRKQGNHAYIVSI